MKSMLLFSKIHVRMVTDIVYFVLEKFGVKLILFELKKFRKNCEEGIKKDIAN